MPQDVQSAAIRHVDVQKNEIPLLLAQLVQCFIAAGGFADRIYGGIGLKKLLETRPHHSMIVGDQYS
jgi:hypothetical protein